MAGSCHWTTNEVEFALRASFAVSFGIGEARKRDGAGQGNGIGDGDGAREKYGDREADTKTQAACCCFYGQS